MAVVFSRSFLACLVLSLGLLSGCGAVSAARPDTVTLLTPAVLVTAVPVAVPPPAPPDVARGFLVYQEKCQQCHGSGGAGDGPRAATVLQQGGLVANLAEPGRARAATPMDWYEVVTAGRLQRLMPPFSGSLSVQQRWDAVAYALALSIGPESIADGRRLYDRRCATCHGARGDIPTGANSARLDQPAYAAEQSLSRIAELTAGAPHTGIRLAEPELASVADAVRAFGFPYTDPRPLQGTIGKGDGKLQVNVSNLTNGAPKVGAGTVVVRIYDQEGEVYSRTQRVDATGVASFVDLPRSLDYFYQAEMRYQGGRFFAAPVQLTTTLPVSATLGVFEVTNDESVISISEMHYFVQDVSENAISVVEVYVFDNKSDRAYVDRPGADGNPRSIRITVPRDARNIRFDGPGLGERFSRDGDVLYDSDAVSPGARSAGITVIYELPYRGSRAIERTFAYPVGRWDVILPDTDLRANATGLTDRGIQETQTTRIRLYAPANPAVAAGGSVSFELTGQPRGSAVPGSEPAAIGVGFIMFALAIGAGYVMFLRSRMSTKDLDVDLRRRRLLRQIAALDDLHEAGKLKPDQYRKRRERLFDDVRDLTESRPSTSGPRR